METTMTRQAECPLCGHVAVVVEDYEAKELIYLCPDRYCPNCPDNDHE